MIVAAGFYGYSVESVAIAVVIIAAIVALVFIALREYKVPVPGWVIHVLWIVAVAFVIILAIKIVAGMG